MTGKSKIEHGVRVDLQIFNQRAVMSCIVLGQAGFKAVLTSKWLWDNLLKVLSRQLTVWCRAQERNRGWNLWWYKKSRSERENVQTNPRSSAKTAIIS